MSIAESEWPATLSRALHDPSWRSFCFRDRTKITIPSGITYLSQLMAHDITLTSAQMDAFTAISDEAKSIKFVNFVDAPLTLSTLYGRPGAADRLLYDRFDPNKFRLTAVHHKGRDWTLPAFFGDPQDAWHTPAFSDQRNFASPILSQIAAEFLDFHNRVVSKVKKLGNSENAFAIARATTIRTWHQVIMKELLPSVARSNPGTRELPDMLKNDSEDQQFKNLIHGAFRCFHSLILEEYKFNENAKSRSSSMLSLDARGPSMTDEASSYFVLSDRNKTEIGEWLDEWGVEWSRFFKTDGFADLSDNMTGFTPSFVFKKGSVNISERDFQAAKAHGISEPAALQMEGLHLDEFYKNLEDVVGPPAPAASWSALAERHGVPLSISLLVDGFSDGAHDGKLGWLASAIVRQEVGKAIEAAEKIVSTTLKVSKIRGVPDRGDLPKSFHEMVKETEFKFMGDV